MPVIEPEQVPEDVEPIAATPHVTAPAKPRRRRRRWPLLVLLALAAGAALAGRDLRLSSHTDAPARMPSVEIPVVSTQAPAPRAAPTPSAPSATPAVTHEADAAARPEGCGFFAAQEIDREYAFERGRADLKLQRAQQLDDHYYALDHDKKAHDARAKAATAEHAATISQLDGRLVRARNACDASLLF
jgi:hypothetical protein